MKHYLLPVLFFAFSIVGCSTMGNTADKLHIKPDAAEFVFHVDSTDMWEWYREETPANAAEYTWSASFELDRDEYKVGFTLFNFDPYEPASGSLEELIEAGQVDVWKVDRISLGGRSFRASGESVDIPLETEVEFNILTIILRDEEILKQFHDSRPNSVEFQYLQPGRQLTTRKINVIYQQNEETDDETDERI